MNHYLITDRKSIETFGLLQEPYAGSVYNISKLFGPKHFLVTSSSKDLIISSDNLIADSVFNFSSNPGLVLECD